MKTPITFGIVAYHESERITRCLDSIAPVAHEIIVVHDGPCRDRTLVIARRYGARTEVRSRENGSDPHRPFILRAAKHDWVFMIDADEFLSIGLQNFLRDFNPAPGIAAYAFKWPFWNGRTYVTSANYRACLFDRRKAWAIGLHNFGVQTTGAVERAPLLLEHRPARPKLGLHLLNTAPFQMRIQRDAQQYAKGYVVLEKFNEHLIPDRAKRYFARFSAHPRCYALYNFIRHFFGAYKTNWRDGWHGFTLSLQLAIYQFKLAMALDRYLKTHVL
jgi:glycosyltransferase involved in cell wall biosynthesis